MTLKRVFPLVSTRFALIVGTASLAFSIGSLAQSQPATSQDPSAQKNVSLADVARQQRTSAHPKAKHVITDEDIHPTDAAVSQSKTDAPAAATEEKDKEKKLSPEQEEKERAKPFLEAVDTQKKRIADAQKKIENLNSERRQRASAQYADMGVLLRDPQKWNQDEKAVQEEIAQKQKEIEDANAKLEEARENARKNGVRLPD